VVDVYALPLKGPGFGIEANEALVDETLAASKPFVPLLQVLRLRGLAEWAGRVGAGLLNELWAGRISVLGQAPNAAPIPMGRDAAATVSQSSIVIAVEGASLCPGPKSPPK